MSSFVTEMRRSAEQYVTKATILVNLILLVCHILFGIYFFLNKAELVYYYNYISIIIYLAAFDFLRRRKAVHYIMLVYAEILLFMIVAVLCMGWDFGFQQYCIGFIIGAFFVDFYTGKEGKIRKVTMIVIGFDVLVYLAMRIWTYRHQCIYQVERGILVEIFFVVNTLAAYLIMILFCFVYSTTVFKLEQSLLNVASVDPMTGLRNRRRMHELLNGVMEEYKEKSYPICVGMLDVDHFKRINDTYGHDVGDVVLKNLADTLLNKHEKKRDFHVCRWGGEEFLVLYKNCPEKREDVYQEFEKLREQIENTVVISGENDKIQFTITIGLAFFENDLSITDILKNADTNLYKGKQSGRNRVVW